MYRFQPSNSRVGEHAGAVCGMLCIQYQACLAREQQPPPPAPPPIPPQEEIETAIKRCLAKTRGLYGGPINLNLTDLFFLSFSLSLPPI